jgi:hypothetical protein
MRSTILRDYGRSSFSSCLYHVSGVWASTGLVRHYRRRGWRRAVSFVTPLICELVSESPMSVRLGVVQESEHLGMRQVQW